MTSRVHRLADIAKRARESNERLFAKGEKRTELRRKLGLDKEARRQPHKIRGMR